MTHFAILSVNQDVVASEKADRSFILTKLRPLINLYTSRFLVRKLLIDVCTVTTFS